MSLMAVRPTTAATMILSSRLAAIFDCVDFMFHFSLLVFFLRRHHHHYLRLLLLLLSCYQTRARCHHLSSLHFLILLPSTQLYRAVRDGVLLARFLSVLFPHAMDFSKINRQPRSTLHAIENHNFFLQAAHKAGCQVRAGGKN